MFCVDVFAECDFRVCCEVALITMKVIFVPGENLWIIFVNNVIFKASALWADAFYKSICPSVCL